MAVLVTKKKSASIEIESFGRLGNMAREESLGCSWFLHVVLF